MKPTTRQQSPEPTVSKTPKKKTLTNSERMKEYRLLQKADPEKYAAHLEANRHRCVAYRANLTEENKKRNAELSKERMQRSRERKREQLLTPNRMETRKDVRAVEEQRMKWNKEYKQRSEKMHWKTRDAINARRREKHQLAKRVRLESRTKEAQCNEAEDLPTVTIETELADDRTPDAQRKAFQRAKAGMPLSPTKYVSTAFHLIKKATPRKKKLFEAFLSTQSAMSKSSKVQQMGQRLIDAIHRLKKKNLREDRLTRKILLNVCSQMGSARSRCLLLNISKKTALHHDLAAGTNGRKESKAKKVEHLAKSFLDDAVTVLRFQTRNL